MPVYETRPGLDFGTFSTSFAATGSAGGLRGWVNVYTFHDQPAAAPTAPVATPAPIPEAAISSGGGAISNTPIPISWGQRRIVGKVVDHIAKALGADGVGAEILCISAGQPLFREVPNNLVKIVANGTTVYDITLGGVIHPGLASVVWYDGTSDAQIQDPTFVAEFGADVVPGYVGQMIATLDYNSYQAWSGARPLHTFFIADAGHGTIYSAWGGTWDSANKASGITLSDSDKTATWTSSAAAGGVRSTVSHSSGRWYFEVEPITMGPTTITGSDLWRFGFRTEASTAGYNYALGSFGGNTVGIANDFTDTRMSYGTAGLGAGSGFVQTPLVMVPGSRYGVAVDLSAKIFWLTPDGVNWYGIDGAGSYTDMPLTGASGLPAIQFITGTDFYLTFSGYDANDAIRIHTTADAFVFVPPGVTGLVTWGDVFVELAPIAHLDAGNIITIDITEASEGGVIYGGFSWTDIVTNAGKISNIDWWEDGQNIYIKQTAFDNPPNDIDGIPLAHRYVSSEDKGSTEAARGGERRKPIVYELSYYDVSRQFQQSMVPARSEANESVKVEKLSVPYVMTAEAAATRSAVALGKSEMEMEEHSLSLPPVVPYVRLRPVDIVEFDEETRGIRSKVRSWLLDSDWNVEIKLQKLFTTAADPTVPLELETIAASLPRYIPWRMDFSDIRNSGYVAAISGQ